MPPIVSLFCRKSLGPAREVLLRGDLWPHCQRQERPAGWLPDATSFSTSQNSPRFWRLGTAGHHWHQHHVPVPAVTCAAPAPAVTNAATLAENQRPPRSCGCSSCGIFPASGTPNFPTTARVSKKQLAPVLGKTLITDGPLRLCAPTCASFPSICQEDSEELAWHIICLLSRLRVIRSRCRSPSDEALQLVVEFFGENV